MPNSLARRTPIHAWNHHENMLFGVWHARPVNIIVVIMSLVRSSKQDGQFRDTRKVQCSVWTCVSCELSTDRTAFIWKCNWSPPALNMSALGTDFPRVHFNHLEKTSSVFLPLPMCAGHFRDLVNNQSLTEQAKGKQLKNCCFLLFMLLKTRTYSSRMGAGITWYGNYFVSVQVRLYSLKFERFVLYY